MKDPRNEKIIIALTVQSVLVEPLKVQPHEPSIASNVKTADISEKTGLPGESSIYVLAPGAANTNSLVRPIPLPQRHYSAWAILLALTALVAPVLFWIKKALQGDRAKRVIRLVATIVFGIVFLFAALRCTLAIVNRPIASKPAVDVKMYLAGGDDGRKLSIENLTGGGVDIIAQFDGYWLSRDPRQSHYKYSTGLQKGGHLGPHQGLKTWPEDDKQYFYVFSNWLVSAECSENNQHLVYYTTNSVGESRDYAFDEATDRIRNNLTFYSALGALSLNCLTFTWAKLLLSHISSGTIATKGTPPPI